MKTSASAKKPKSKKTGAKPSPAAEPVDAAAVTISKPAVNEESKETVATAPVLEGESVEHEAPVSAKKPASRFRMLFKLNIWLAAAYALQGIAILVLSAAKYLPVTTTFLSKDELASALADSPVLVSASQHLFDVQVTYLVAAFLFVGAVAHTLIATICRTRYEDGLRSGVSRARWISLAIGIGFVSITVALSVGITNLGTLALLFALSGIMSICGWAAELYRQKNARAAQLVSLVGLKAGFLSLLVIGLALFGAGIWGSAQVPAYLYWIYATMIAYIAILAAAMSLQAKKAGKWADYVYGERVFLVVAFIAQTALAWQVFAGMLRP